MADMFLYAHLAIEYLLQQPTKEKLLEKIKVEMLPKELSKMCVWHLLLSMTNGSGITLTANSQI